MVDLNIKKNKNTFNDAQGRCLKLNSLLIRENVLFSLRENAFVCNQLFVVVLSAHERN